jgi:hypothetical protein
MLLICGELMTFDRGPVKPNRRDYRACQGCFSDFGTPASSVTQGRDERHQICFFGGNLSRWRSIPTRSV